jgi:hypothetical protein
MFDVGGALMEAGAMFLMVMLTIGVVAVLGLLAIGRSLRHIQVPPHAGFFTTMHYVPFILVVLLDLLDLGLDVFSAPISWVLLDRMGLSGLRNIASFEGLLPFTGPIPTLTIAWIMARLFHVGDDARWQQYAPAHSVYHMRDNRHHYRHPIDRFDQ